MKIFNIKMIILLWIVSIKFGYSQCDFQNITFPLTQADQDFLYYFVYQNNFDSVSVSCLIGEFTVKSNNSTIKIPVIKYQSERTTYLGQDQIGIDTVLAQKSKTIPFTYIAGDSLKFFRQLSISNPCWSANDLPSDGEMQSLSWLDKYFVTGKNRILDRSEFVIQIVRKSDDLVLTNIDSVGIDTNPNSILPNVYGYNAKVMNLIKKLPVQFAGTAVYLKVSPRRFGSTPNGMDMAIEPVQFSLSSIKEYTSSLFELKCSYEYIDSLENLHYSNLISYCNSFKAQNGELPYGAINRYLFKPGQFEYFVSLFYDSVFYQGNKLYVEKSYLGGGANSINEKSESLNGIRILNYYPNPGKNNEISLYIESSNDFGIAEISIVDIYGTNKKSYFFTPITKGGNLINFKHDLPSGTYFLILSNKDINLASKKFVVIK